MLRLFRNKRAQSTAEYAILIGLVVAAVVGIQTYVKRGIQGRYKDATVDYIDNLTTDPAGLWNTIGGNRQAQMINKEGQFEPEELSAKSTSETLPDSYERTEMKKGGKVERTSKGATQQEKGDFQKYDYPQPQ